VEELKVEPCSQGSKNIVPGDYDVLLKVIKIEKLSIYLMELIDGFGCHKQNIESG